MRRFRILMGLSVFLIIFSSLSAVDHAQIDTSEACRGLSPEMQQFAEKLNTNNKMTFCKFSDVHRRHAMKLASQKNTYGKPMMTPDQSVEKVASDIKSTAP